MASKNSLTTGYDILGNIVIVKFDRNTKINQKKKWAFAFLKERKQVRTVLEKSSKFSGRLRTNKTKFIFGENTKEAVYKENGCIFRFNTDSCYFSPRLSTERKEIASLIKKDERVLVLFAGVAPFGIVIAKYSQANKVVCIELGRECCRYALENVKRNKLSNVEIIQGDVKKILPKLTKKKEKFDKIVMARPNLNDSFLNVSFPLIKKGGIIYYYGFYQRDDLNKLKTMLIEEASLAKKKIKILNIKEAGNIGIRKFRYRADIKVLD